MRLGIIDLGSNTFHLLIIDSNKDGTFSEVFRLRKFIGLSKGGTERINEGRLLLGLDACNKFKSKLECYKVNKLKIVGTAILRSAINKDDFILPCQALFGVPIEIIDGKREAELIYKGVSLLSFDFDAPCVIIDIGGGSVEYIFVENNQLIWCESFPIGVGVLHNTFHTNEPIDELAVKETKDFIKKTLAPLLKVTNNKSIKSMVGASGSFEVVEMMNKGVTDQFETNISKLLELSQRLIKLNFEERLALEDLPNERAEFIVVAMILMEVSIELINPEHIYISPYAIKEGLLTEMMNSNSTND